MDFKIQTPTSFFLECKPGNPFFKRNFASPFESFTTNIKH